MTRRWLLSVSLALFLFCNSADAKLIVNEVLSNEPQGYTGLEWFEIYNDAAGTANLNFYQIDANGTQLVLNDSVGGHSFLVICRKLVGIPASPGFEMYWGDSSGVWGDSPKENYRVIEAGFGLTNASGSVGTSFLGNIESSLTWTTSGADGISWERKDLLSLEFGQSIDPIGSTPGRSNSLAPSNRDLALDSIDVRWQSGVTTLTFLITSRSLSTVSGASVLLYLVNPNDSTDFSNQLETVSIPAVDTGFTTAVVRELTLTGTYTTVGGLLSPDDRLYDNRRVRTVPSQGYPPVILSEFLANPTGGLTSEWVELYNREDTAVSLGGWQLGDSTGLTAPLLSIELPSHRYLVIAEDSSAFRQFYGDFSGQLASVSGWRALNNASDIVRLVDSFGFAADQFAYAEAYPDNSTWGRSNGDNRWGKSSALGGSPGEVNDIRFAPNASTLKLDIQPRVFSPDGDGVDDSALIVITAPKADVYTVRIYTSGGRLVRTFEHESPDLAGEYGWDGRDDSGGRLPLGLYIVYVEASGVQSVKQTVVVAR